MSNMIRPIALALLFSGPATFVTATFAQPGAAGDPGPQERPASAEAERDAGGPPAGFPPAMNLPGVDIGELIERLAAEMDREFVLDQRMRGIFGGTTAGADADYETLLAILRQSGFATIETADQILIVPEGSARTQPSRVLAEDDRRISDHEIVTRVIDVPDFLPPREGIAGSASQLVPLLRPMLGQSAHLGAVAGSNKLIVVDRYDNVRRIEAVIAALD